MRQFLRETWELWYWAHFCPSKLQRRMNEWAPAEEKSGGTFRTTDYRDILLFRANRRFLAQFFFLVLILSFPLILMIALSGQPLGWWLVVAIPFITYGLGVYSFLPFALHLPLLFTLLYLANAPLLYETLADVLAQFPPLSRMVQAGVMGCLGLIATSWMGIRLWLAQWIQLGRLVLVVGQALSYAGGIYFATQSNVATISTMLVVGGLTYLFVRDEPKNTKDAGAVAGAVAVLGFLPLPLLSLAGWLIGSSFARRVQHRWGIGAAVVLALLAVEQQGGVGLLVIPPTLIGYYRLLDYSVLSFISLSRILQLGYKSSNLLFGWLPTLQPNNNIAPERLGDWLHTLPPHNHEILWFRLPGHAHILATTFKKHPQIALETWQQMRSSAYRGLSHTAQHALPQIVSDQLLAPTSVNELIATATTEHPILPFLVPLLYQPEEENLSTEALPQLTTLAPVDAETATMLPRLQRIARDVGAALEGGSAFLRERGLEGTLNKLARLQGQLPGMGLDSSAIARWRAVLVHWQAVIQGELEKQQAASQGEVLNPFQSGNPLRVERAYLFKGRQQFADDILRQVISRSRPTLVLHGPRRCGKSSFLYNLSRLLPSDIIPVYLDLQSAASISSEANFCYGLVRAMGRDMRSQGLNAPAAKRREFRSDPYAALEDWLDEAEQVLESRRILFCFDEFEKLGSAMKEGKISLTLFDQLRHLIQHRDELSFLFCGVQTLAELGPNWSSYFISIEPVEMLYLKPNEAQELLEDPDPDFNLGYEAGIVEEVLRVTRCQPYLVQLIGEAMVKQANQHHTQRITPPLLEAALESALTAGEPYFTNLWDEYTGQLAKPDEVAAGRRVLHALAHKQPLPSLDDADAATRDAIRRMVRYHVVEQDETGVYRFEVPFVERWVRERAVND